VIQSVEDRLSAALRDLRPAIPYSGRRGASQPLATRMAELCSPGVSVAVVDDFDVTMVRGIGTRAHGTAAEINAGTPFQAASISKTVFALAVMRLVQDGILNLDENVNAYLKSWHVPKNDGWNPFITLRQLLSHTAGTTVHGFMGYPANGPLPTLRQTLQGEPPANSPPVVVDMLPGFQCRYSGGGTTIAQQAVVDVLAKSFPSLMRELVLDPLRLADSTFEQPLPTSMATRAAIGHRWSFEQVPGGWHVYPEMAAAGLWTNAGDLARLGSDLLRALRGEKSALGLTRATVLSMLQPQLPDQKIGQPFYGLGWSCNNKDDHFHFGHRGWNEGFLAELRLLPALGKGAVVMINSNQGWPLLGETLEAIGREYEWPTAQNPDSMIEPRVTADYSGAYRSQSGILLRVESGAGGLSLQTRHQPPLPLARTSETEFFTTALNLHVQFERADDGQVVCLTLNQGGERVRFIRESERGLPAL